MSSLFALGCVLVMKKLLWGIILVVIAFVATFKGYIWYQVYNQLSEIKEQLAPHARIQYSWIFSTFDGRVGVSGIEITPYLLKGTVSIDEVSLKLEDAAALFNFKDNISQRRLPDQMLFSIKNMSLPLDSDLANLLSFFDDNGGEVSDHSNFNPLGVYSCGDTAVVKNDELKAMGYDKFTLSSDVGYRLDPMTNVLTVTSLVDSDSLGRSDIKVELGVTEGTMASLLTTPSLPVFNRAQWDFNDGGYFRRLSFFCGKKTGVERTAYVAQAAQEWDADLQDHGITLNASLVDVYRQYILDGGLLNISVAPDKDIDYSALSLFSANDVVSMLNLQVKLNGNLLPDLSLALEEAKLAGFYGEPAVNEKQVNSAETLPLTTQAPEKSYQEILTDEAETYLNYPVRVELDSGKKVEGMVISVDEFVIEVEQVVSGGKVSYPLRKRNITLMSVWK